MGGRDLIADRNYFTVIVANGPRENGTTPFIEKIFFGDTLFSLGFWNSKDINTQSMYSSLIHAYK